ncbi:Crp/Fnr family transcriptional regulator [Emticicia sp. SJ17W-69]|uniref:Crp/Fnr family transcriptional regulator n=1 Tax=Emticicia sp. SJ17W-69 TaxID=3421657 RepID=UPI003EC0C8B4
MANNNLLLFIQNILPIPTTIATEIVNHFKDISIPKNHYLVQEGKISNEYVFLLDGLIRSYTFDTEGNDITTNFYTKNHIVLEVSSFFNRTPAQESFQALTDCKGLIINYEQVQILFHSIPEFREFGRKVLVQNITTLKQRMLSMINQTAEERYEDLILTKPEILQNAPLKNIATYLGITDTSLSRIRKEFTKKGG